MVVLDNLVVSVALPSIHRDLGASIQSLEWTVNAYVLAYAVLLLTGAALGDRFGRKRDLHHRPGALHRRFRGRRARAEHRPADRRARGPGHRRRDRHAADADPARGRLPRGASWHRAGGVVGHQRHRRRDRPAGRRRRHPGHLLALDLLDQRPDRRCPGAARRAPARREPRPRRDARPHGLALGSAGLFGLVFGLVRAQSLGWTSAEVDRRSLAGAVLLVAFVCARSAAPANRCCRSLLRQTRLHGDQRRLARMYFGMFGSIFFLSQFLQNVLHNTPLQAGLKLLVWTGATMVVSPLAGFFSERFGSRPFMVAGLALQAGALGWLAPIASTHSPTPACSGRSSWPAPAWRWSSRPPPTRCSRRCAPTRPARPPARPTRSASSAACSASRCSPPCSPGTVATASPQAFVNGLVPALWVGTAVLGGGSLIAAAVPVQHAGDRRGPRCR